MATQIHCNVCGHVESVTADTPEPLPGWLVTTGTDGETSRTCPTSHANRPRPSERFTIDEDML
jgi:hypothetical protein